MNLQNCLFKLKNNLTRSRKYFNFLGIKCICTCMCALRGYKPPTWVLFISQLEALHFTNDLLCPINHTTAYHVAEVKKKSILMRAEVKTTVTWTATSLNRRHSVSVWINVPLTLCFWAYFEKSMG